MPKQTKVSCDSCDVLVLNGMICHETGCRDAWKYEKRECKWCGQEFKPEYKDQWFCDIECKKSFMG